MKNLIVLFMVAWLALPHNQSAAEMKVVEAACKTCGGDVYYTPGDEFGECEICHEKFALALLMIIGCVCVCVGGCYTVKRLKKLGAPGGRFDPTNRFGTNLYSALMDPQISGMSVVSGGSTNDVPWLLSLNTPTNSSGRYVLEQSTDLQTWTELGRYADADFLAVNESPIAGAFYRVRVNP